MTHKLLPLNTKMFLVQMLGVFLSIGYSGVFLKVAHHENTRAPLARMSLAATKYGIKCHPRHSANLRARTDVQLTELSYFRAHPHTVSCATAGRQGQLKDTCHDTVDDTSSPSE